LSRTIPDASVSGSASLEGPASFAYPPHIPKFEIIGGLFGAPYRLAKCGVGDLEVPASAEIVIEGEILRNVKR
jgi:2,5-furandicarboxylate decarboxylase 1